MVRQEIYGDPLTRYAISALISRAATEADIDPDRVKFLRTVRIIRRRAAGPAFPPDQARQVTGRDHGRHHQPAQPQPSPADRSYPRVVRRARHNSYRVKRPGDTGTRHTRPPAIRLVNLPAPTHHDQLRLSGIEPRPGDLSQGFGASEEDHDPL